MTGDKTVETPHTSKNLSKIFILIPNASKSNNLGPILRCAAAYAAYQIVFVGYARCSTDGSHGSAKHLNIVAFPTLNQAVKYLRDECHVRNIVGLLGDVGLATGDGDDADGDYDDLREEVIEDNEKMVVKVAIGRKREERRRYKVVQGSDRGDRSPQHQPYSYPPSYPVYTRPFSATKINAQMQQYENDSEVNVYLKGQGGGTGQDTGARKDICFSISKQRAGLPIDQARSCDFFLHIPRMVLYSPSDNDYTEEGAEDKEEMIDYGMLDAQTSLSIALHHYTAWANYEERTISGQKFDLDKKQKGHCNSKLEATTSEGAINTYGCHDEDEHQVLVQDERKDYREVLEQASENVMEDGDWCNLFTE